jgi:hypothetical protein
MVACNLGLQEASEKPALRRRPRILEPTPPSAPGWPRLLATWDFQRHLKDLSRGGRRPLLLRVSRRCFVLADIASKQIQPIMLGNLRAVSRMLTISWHERSTARFRRPALRSLLHVLSLQAAASAGPRPTQADRAGGVKPSIARDGRQVSRLCADAGAHSRLNLAARPAKLAAVLARLEANEQLSYPQVVPEVCTQLLCEVRRRKPILATKGICFSRL